MSTNSTTIDPITLEVLRHAFAAVADEMNANLVRSAYSPNIKERRDCSCALFDGRGAMVAMECRIQQAGHRGTGCRKPARGGWSAGLAGSASLVAIRAGMSGRLTGMTRGLPQMNRNDTF